MRSPRSFSYVTAFVLPLLVGAPLLAEAAGKDGGRQPASEKLAVAPLTVNVRSWNGRIAPPPVTPARPTNPRWPTRAPDPMAIVVNGAHPRTKVELLRQRQSKDVSVPGCVTDCSVLEKISADAAEYVPMAAFTTRNASNRQPAAHIVTEPSKVAWPHSRVLIRATTRDGQAHDAVPAVVEGLPDQQEMRYDAVSMGPQHTQISGRLLPAARAWIKANNVFVSEPTRNVELQDQGRALDREAGAEERELEGIPGKLEREQASTKQGGPDYTKIQELQQRQAVLQQSAPQKRQQAADMILRGKKLTVQVLSVGGTPAATPITTINTRLAGEQGQGVTHTASSNTAATHGYLSHEVEAIDDDEVTMRADFSGGNANSSWANLSFRVPAGASAAKPAFTMNGVKYYRAQPTAQTQGHDPDPVDPPQ